MDNKNNKNSKSIYLKIFLGLLCLAICLIATFYFRNEIKLFIQKFTSPKQITEIKDYLTSFGKKGWLIFEAVQIIKVIVAIIPGEPIELLSGAMFGAFWGTVSCMIGNVIGSIIVFFLIKKHGIRLARFFANSEKLNQLSFLHSTQKLELFIFIIFFLPGTPKDILTYFAPLTKIKPSRYFLIVCFARIPSILTSTMTGANIINGDFRSAIIIFVIATIISIIGYIIHTIIVKYHEKKQSH